MKQNIILPALESRGSRFVKVAEKLANDKIQIDFQCFNALAEDINKNIKPPDKLPNELPEIGRPYYKKERKTVKLNLRWVSDTIGDSYKKWELGSTVIIEAQTGTGKTFFIKNVLIDYLGAGERLLFVCNRTYLKRQLKIDLLKKFGLPIPMKKNKKGIEKIDMDALDDITTIKNITITSYQAIQHAALDEKYDGKLFDLKLFTYVVMDECHYIMADAGFVNDCKFAYEKLIKDRCINIIKIFISATINEVREPIIKCAKKGIGIRPKIHEYTTGIDYSYLNPIYFDNNWTDIINTIKNDKTDEKWLIFISDLEDGNKILKELGKDNCSIIKAGSKSDELDSIISSSKFNNKVLICTKAMDNGINIDDDLVKNIVIMAWDKITFIQELGRRRVDISKEVEVINLYIPTRMKKSFLTKLKLHLQKQSQIDLLDSDRRDFNKKYDNKIKKLGEMEDIFFRNMADGEWKVNLIGYARLIKDTTFTQYMVNRFDRLGKFTYVQEQLKWLKLIETFDPTSLIENVILDEDIMKLEDYLDSIVGNVMLQAKDRKELIEKIGLIDVSHSNISKGIIKLLKNIDTLNCYLNEINSQFRIKHFETSKSIDGKKKNFKDAWKVQRLLDE